MDAPSRLNQSVQQFLQVVEDLAGRIREESCGRPDLRTVELAVRDSLRIVGQAAMSELAEAYGTGRSGNRQACGCGSQARFKAVHARQVTDLYGGVLQLRRAYYFCEACGQGMLPLDRELGLGSEELTPALADIVEMLGVIAPFESAARVVEQTLGVQISGERVRRRTERTGAQCLVADEMAAQRACAPGGLEPSVAERPMVTEQHFYVMVDGGMVPTHEGYREAKVGVCFKTDDHIEKGETRHMLVHKRFFGDIDTADAFGQRMYAATQDHGVAHDGNNCDLLADGAPWIWNLKAEHLPQARETVDWYHAKEHIFTAAHALYGEGTQAATAWAEARAGELWREKHTNVLAALHSTRPRSPVAQQAVVELDRYITTNRRRMRYSSRRAAGLLVGSGPIEGGISYVVQNRLKRTGMRWSVCGARKILALRMRWASGTWESRPAAASAAAQLP
jgi:hypothetical protein